MDAVTMFEVEAARRRETVASDRDQALARAMIAAERVDPVVGTRMERRRLPAQADCGPAPLARQSAG